MKATFVNESIYSKMSAARLAWFFLAFAIASEVIGLIVMKSFASSGYPGGYAILFVLIALSYVFLAKAVKTISVGVAYAVWEGSGIALITLISAYVFQHMLSNCEIVGITMAIIGILMVNAGEVHKENEGASLRTKISEAQRATAN